MLRHYQEMARQEYKTCVKWYTNNNKNASFYLSTIDCKAIGARIALKLEKFLNFCKKICIYDSSGKILMEGGLSLTIS